MTYKIEIDNNLVEFQAISVHSTAIHNGKIYEIVAHRDTEINVRSKWSNREIITVIALALLGIAPGIIAASIYGYKNRARWCPIQSPGSQSVPTVSKVTGAAIPRLHIYTTGLAENAVCKRWNHFYYPHLKQIYSGYETVITHYDPQARTSKIEGGTFIKGAFDAACLNRESPSVVFDFAHCIEDYEKNSNALYIPYENDVTSEKFLNFGLRPFTLENDQVVTYISKIRDKKYKIIEKSMTFIDKTKKEIQFTYKTIELDGAIFDTEEKLKYLYKLIGELRLKQLFTDLELTNFSDFIIANIPPEHDKGLLTLINDLSVVFK